MSASVNSWNFLFSLNLKWYLIVIIKQKVMSKTDTIRFSELIFMCENAVKIGIKKNINVWFLVSIWWSIKEKVNKSKIKKFIKFSFLK